MLTLMNARMVHRGPDDEGIFVEPGGGVALGARRLSIIDVAGGHQPLANEDETIWAVLNGEVYNFRALRERLRQAGHVFATRTDTEVLVHLYEERGDQLVHELDGMFAFAIWDSKACRLVLARDRFGEKPLFYSELAGTLSFASELTALLAGLAIRPDLDLEALDSYFVYGYVSGARSVVSGVRQLEPGNLLVHDLASGATATKAYWRPPRYETQRGRKADALVDSAAELLDAAVRSRLIADVPLGVFLSGGLDSTLIAAIAARHVGAQLKTFTVDYDVGAVGERQGAGQVAAAVGADHHEFVFSTADVKRTVPAMLAGLDQPIADPAFVALRALSEFARTEVKVAVGGEGADELFGGYPRYRWLARSARVPAGAASRLPALATGKLGRIRRFERLRRVSDALAPGSTFDRHLGWVTSGRAELRGELYGQRLAPWLQENGGHCPPAAVNVGGSDVVGALMQLDQLHWLPDDVLAKADRASMGASLELRTPFLSPDLVSFAASISPSLHVRGGGKFLLREVLERTFPSVGRSRPKVAFRTPVAEWLRGPLGASLAGQLDENPLYRDGWFSRATVAGWVRRHATGREDLSHALWPAFVLGCWFGEYAANG
jgi:asparagine synthase (glutamine-hydrolysing)